MRMMENKIKERPGNYSFGNKMQASIKKMGEEHEIIKS